MLTKKSGWQKIPEVQRKPPQAAVFITRSSVVDAGHADGWFRC